MVETKRPFLYFADNYNFTYAEYFLVCMWKNLGDNNIAHNTILKSSTSK